MPRRLLVLAIGPIAAALAACEAGSPLSTPTAPATPPGAVAPASANAKVHSATGGGKVDRKSPPLLPFPATVSFTASVDGNGIANGQVQAHFAIPDVIFHMEIICLSVAGNEAWVGGRVTSSQDETLVPVGQTRVFRVRDNGQGAGSANDELSRIDAFVDPAAFCANQPAIALPFEWVAGNIQVK
jgi:hypothetical protein